jgi:recombination protein RecR
MEFPSKVIENAIQSLAGLPGIGKKTALRLALHILKQPDTFATQLGESLIALRRDVKYCKNCHNLSDLDTCNICLNPRRDKQVLCVVEDMKDVIAIESTHQFHGHYHVLGGVINPLMGIGPSQLTIESLLDRVKADEVTEVIFAFSANIEGDTTGFYIGKKLSALGVKVSSIARGIPIGLELEYTDEITLARSILNRTLITLPSTEG